MTACIYLSNPRARKLCPLLRKARENLKLSREEAALITGHSAHSLFRWETGKGPVTLDTAEELCALYNVKLWELLKELDI